MYEEEFKDRLLRHSMKWEYGFDIPEDTEFTILEFCAILEDYDDYVQDCYTKSTQPMRHEEFKEHWNILYNADLYKLEVGSTIYYQGYEEDELCLYKIIKKKTLEDGIVEVTVKSNKEEYIAISGEVYKSNLRWS